MLRNSDVFLKLILLQRRCTTIPTESRPMDKKFNCGSLLEVYEEYLGMEGVVNAHMVHIMTQSGDQ